MCNVAEHPPDRILRDRTSDTARADGPGFRGQAGVGGYRSRGLGLVGGGYGEADWLQAQIGETDGARVGYGFITWSLARNPRLLDNALAQQPATVMLFFADLTQFAERIRGAGVPLTAQVQTLHQARLALAVGAQIIVAQGGEAGGHGMGARSTFTLVPDVVDLVAQRSPETLVVAAGGVAAVDWLPRWRSGPTACSSAPRSGRRPRRWYHREPSSEASTPTVTTPCAPGSMTLCGSVIGLTNTTPGWSATP